MSNSASTILRPLAHDIRNHAAVAKGFLGIALGGDASPEILGEIQGALAGIDSTLALLDPFVRAQALLPSATANLLEICTPPFCVNITSPGPAGSELPARLALALEYFTEDFVGILGPGGEILVSAIPNGGNGIQGLQIGVDQELSHWHAPDSKHSPAYPKLRLALAHAIVRSVDWHLQIGTSESKLSGIRLLQNSPLE